MITVNQILQSVVVEEVFILLISRTAYLYSLSYVFYQHLKENLCKKCLYHQCMPLTVFKVQLNVVQVCSKLKAVPNYLLHLQLDEINCQLRKKVAADTVLCEILEWEEEKVEAYVQAYTKVQAMVAEMVESTSRRLEVMAANSQDYNDYCSLSIDNRCKWIESIMYLSNIPITYSLTVPKWNTGRFLLAYVTRALGATGFSKGETLHVGSLYSVKIQVDRAHQNSKFLGGFRRGQSE